MPSGSARSASSGRASRLRPRSGARRSSPSGSRPWQGSCWSRCAAPGGCSPSARPSVVAAWYYTGGSNPYGYQGLGELFVFVFFGLVAVLGTTYTQALRISLAAVLAAVAVGFLACAILVANNLRDVPTDTVSGKRTLAVRLGERRTRWLYAALVAGAFVCAVVTAVVGAPEHLPALAVLAATPLAVLPVQAVLRGAWGPGLVPVLGATGRLELLFALLLGLGLAA